MGVKSAKRSTTTTALIVLVALLSGPMQLRYGSSGAAWIMSSSRRGRISRHCSSAIRLFLSKSSASPPLSGEWKGSSHSTSDFVTHVVIGDDHPSVSTAIASVLSNNVEKRPSNNGTSFKDDIIPVDNSLLQPHHLLQLGAVWFLPAGAPRNPSDGQKPIRLSMSDGSSTLEEGDYLRIHPSPRRFPKVYNYNWASDAKDSSCTLEDSGSIESVQPGVIVGRDDDKGYLVIEKPSHVPVHPMVDNAIENVAEMIRRSEVANKDENGRLRRHNEQSEQSYVSTPQRLDQNTSGLLVVATKRSFASYFAELLRKKTDSQLMSSNMTISSKGGSDAIHKRYKCLACLVDPNADNYQNGAEHGTTSTATKWSVATAMNRLGKMVKERQVMKHYLEPSIRAPKYFASSPGNDTWAECLLRLTNVGDVCPLVGSDAGKELASGLWSKQDGMPRNCVAVVEVEIELLTGRTHQIRGQLAVEGFPLVGDAQYGGAVPGGERVDAPASSKGYIHSDELALQCSQLEFLDPNIVVRPDGTEVMVPSDRWNTFQLDECWWTPLISMYRASSAGDTTTSLQDIIQALKMQAAVAAEKQVMSSEDMFPPQVILSPGAHKYVLIKAMHPSDSKDRWFVKSASPSECGGPYHANVAQDLVDWLEATGFESIEVTGGGRVDYNQETKQVRVYGFSYGFGKCDHAKAASIIREWGNGTISATFDNSDTLY